LPKEFNILGNSSSICDLLWGFHQSAMKILMQDMFLCTQFCMESWVINEMKMFLMILPLFVAVAIGIIKA